MVSLCVARTGITANFVNHKTRAERQLTQQRRAFQFARPYFERMEAATGVWMENLVYMRCSTNHYFVFTPRKAGLLKQGVVKEMRGIEDGFLSPGNVDRGVRTVA